MKTGFAKDFIQGILILVLFWVDAAGSQQFPSHLPSLLDNTKLTTILYSSDTSPVVK